MALFARDITSTCFCRISQHQHVYSSTTVYQRASLRILQAENYDLHFMLPEKLTLSSMLVICHQRSLLYGVKMMNIIIECQLVTLFDVSIFQSF